MALEWLVLVPERLLLFLLVVVDPSSVVLSKGYWVGVRGSHMNGFRPFLHEFEQKYISEDLSLSERSFEEKTREVKKCKH